MSEDLSRRIANKVAEVAGLSGLCPGVIVVHQLPNFALLFMSENGLSMLNQKWNDIKDLTNEEYHRRFFNEEDAKGYVPKILELLQRNTDEAVSFFQQVRTSKTREWDWYLSTIKILMRDDLGNPLLTINVAMQIDPNHYFTAKAARLLEENNFLKTHYPEFSTLTTREREILKLLSLGKTSIEISKDLFISLATAETHRKNIKRKLAIASTYDLSMYARSFDLI